MRRRGGGFLAHPAEQTSGGSPWTGLWEFLTARFQNRGEGAGAARARGLNGHAQAYEIVL
jgi:hypothetical protein